MNWCKIFCWKHIFPGLENQVKNGWEHTRACAGLCRGCLQPSSRYFPAWRCSWPWFELTEAKLKTKLGKSYFFFLSFLVIPTGQNQPCVFFSWALYTSAGFMLLKMTRAGPAIFHGDLLPETFSLRAIFLFPRKCSEMVQILPRVRACSQEEVWVRPLLFFFTWTKV